MTAVIRNIQNTFLLRNIPRLCQINRFSTQQTQAKTTNDLPTEKDRHYDVIIVGGGPAGLSMACAISKKAELSDRNVLLLDGGPKFKGYNTEKYSNRVFAISKNTVGLMKSIGAWDTITSIRCQAVKQMQVWDASSDANISFNHDNFSDNVAYIVENDVLIYGILKEIEKCTNIMIENGSKINEVLLPEDGSPYSTVKLANGQTISCDLLIGADGANSLVRKQMNVENFSLSYNQMGLIATVELREEGDNNVAWQRFLPNGVLALLPLSDKLSSIVWSTDTNNVKRLLALTEEKFIDALNEAFWKQYPKNELINNAMKTVSSILGSYSQTAGPLPPSIKSVYESSRAAFPLGFGHSTSYVAKGTALIGDAAHRVHPLAGQGLNLGFGDVKCLTNLLATASYNGYPLGDWKHLCKYEQQRLQHNVPIMLGVHALQRLYGTDLGPFVLMRSIGLQMTHAITPLKKLFMERAMS